MRITSREIAAALPVLLSAQRADPHPDLDSLLVTLADVAAARAPRDPTARAVLDWLAAASTGGAGDGREVGAEVPSEVPADRRAAAAAAGPRLLETAPASADSPTSADPDHESGAP